MSRLAACIAVACILGGCVHRDAHTNRLPYYNAADFTPIWIDDTGARDATVTHRIASFTCIDQEGRTISDSTVRGKIHVADFFFTRCSGICPAMTSNLRTVQDAFTSDTSVVLLSFSVAPRGDSVRRLGEYAGMFGVDAKRWHLLTGEKSEIYQLARTSYFAEESIGLSRDSSQFLHTEHFVLVDRTGRIRGIYNGTVALDAQRLIEDIRTLEGEGGVASNLHH